MEQKPEVNPPLRVGDFRLNKAFMLCFVEKIGTEGVKVRYGLHKIEMQPFRVVQKWRMASGGEVLERLNVRERCNWTMDKRRTV